MCGYHTADLLFAFTYAKKLLLLSRCLYVNNTDFLILGVCDAKSKNTKNTTRTRIDVYETLCPQQMLVQKGGKIRNWGGECRDVTPTKLQNWGVRMDVNEELKFL